jgi:hypothetical protein
MTDTELHSIIAQMTANDKKIESVKSDIKVQEDAFDAIPRDIEGTSGYKYYLTEKERIARGMTSTTHTFDSKIADLEAKKQIMMDEFDRKIQKVEAEKAAGLAKLESQNGYYDKLMLEMREKAEKAVPTSLTYRKLIAQLAQSEKEKIEIQKTYNEVLARHLAQAEKRSQQMQREQEAKRRQAEQLDRAERQRAQEEYDARIKRENEESLARYRQREAAKTTIVSTPPPPENKIPTTPPVKRKVKIAPKESISFPLNPRTRYTIQQLDELQDKYIEEDMTKEDAEMFSRCWAYASRWNNSAGWHAYRHNHVGEEKDGDIISEKDFREMFE